MHGRKTKWKRGGRRRRRIKNKSLTASHPSVRGQRSQEHWVGATGNHGKRTCYPQPGNLITALEFPKNINAKCTSFLGIIIADRKFDHFGCSVDGCTYHSYPQGNHQDICGLRRPITSLWPEVRGKGRSGHGCETACETAHGVILHHGQCEVCVAM